MLEKGDYFFSFEFWKLGAFKRMGTALTMTIDLEELYDNIKTLFLAYVSKDYIWPQVTGNSNTVINK